MRFDLLSLSKPFRALFFTIAVSLIGSSLLAADNELTAQEKTDGWQLLFDGRTLDGWQTNNQKPSLRPVDEGGLNRLSSQQFYVHALRSPPGSILETM